MRSSFSKSFASLSKKDQPSNYEPINEDEPQRLQKSLEVRNESELELYYYVVYLPSLGRRPVLIATTSELMRTLLH